jgi:chaperonin GroES
MDEVRIHPIGARVLIKPQQVGKTKAVRGIYIPDIVNERPQYGEVVAIGDQEDAIKVEVGNMVLYPKNSGVEVYLNDTLFVIIEAKNLLAIIKD